MRWAAKLQKSIDDGTVFARQKKRKALPHPSAAASGLEKGRPGSIGIDFGGVIVEHGVQVVMRGGDVQDTMFGQNYLESPANIGAVEAVSELVKALGPRNVFIVSKAKETMRKKTLEWLEYNAFFEKTGMFHCNVFFCREREDKGPIAEKIGIESFVDDNIPCLTCTCNLLLVHVHVVHACVCSKECLTPKFWVLHLLTGMPSKVSLRMLFGEGREKGEVEETGIVITSDWKAVLQQMRVACTKM